MAVRHFVKYTFLQLDPAWRRLHRARRAEHKHEFLAAARTSRRPSAAELLARRHPRRRRADAGIETENLDRIHEFHVVLAQSGLMKWARSRTVPGAAQDVGVQRRGAPVPRRFRGKYLFVYPFVKTRARYGLDPQERRRIMQEQSRSAASTRRSTTTRRTRSASTTRSSLSGSTPTTPRRSSTSSRKPRDTRGRPAQIRDRCPSRCTPRPASAGIRRRRAR